MSLLNKSKYNKQDYKLVGVSLPLRVRNYLTLYTIAKETSKSKILKCLIDSWMAEHREKEPDSELINAIVQRIKIRWKVEKASGKGMPYTDFKNSIEFELHKKEVPELYIKLILQEIN